MGLQGEWGEAEKRRRYAETAKKWMPPSGGRKEKTMKRMYAKMRCLAAGLQRKMGKILHDEEGMGTVEVILIILVLIGLVIIFKSQLTDLVESIFTKITKQAGTI